MTYSAQKLGAYSPERAARRAEAHRVFREARAARVAALGDTYMPCHQREDGAFILSRPVTLGTFSSDAKAAIAANPDYFVWWYTAKSLGLVAAVAALAYYVGKDRGRKT